MRITIVEFLISYSYSSTSSSCGLAMSYWISVVSSTVRTLEVLRSDFVYFTWIGVLFFYFDFCQRVTYIQITLFFLATCSIFPIYRTCGFSTSITTRSIIIPSERRSSPRKRSGISISIDFFNVLFSDISRLLPFFHRPSEKVLCGAHTIAREPGGCDTNARKRLKIVLKEFMHTHNRPELQPYTSIPEPVSTETEIITWSKHHHHSFSFFEIFISFTVSTRFSSR